MTPTAEQKKAIDYPGSMVIIAKPGSGKTFVIAEKIRSILPVLPDYRGVIAISYTNKASAELKRRISRNGCPTKSCCLSTIDSFCLSEIIYPFLPHLWGNHPVCYEVKKRDDSLEYGCDIKISGQTASENDILCNEISLRKAFAEKGFIFVDFIGSLALYVLKRSHACRTYIKARYSHIFVDEYQDADQNQHDIFLFLHDLGLVAVAVGDASQSIFGFAGKKADFLLNLPNHPGFTLFLVSYNHRCHPSICNYANTLISSNASLLECERIQVYEKCCHGDEASICSWIDQNLPAIVEHFQCENLDKVGILTPNNLISRRMGSMLTTPNNVFCTHPLEDRQSLTTNLLSQILRFYFDRTVTCEDFIDSFYGDCVKNLRLKSRGLLRDFRKSTPDNFVFETIRLTRSLANFTLLESDFEILKKDSFENLKLFFSPPSPNHINIMTCHKSKGLEFDIVFITHLYAWIVPFKASCIGDITDQDINLHYVSITRGRKACYLCHSTSRHKKNGCIINATPSPFLTIPNLRQLRKVL